MWDCPFPLSDGEEIEIEDSFGTISARVVDTINGVISVSFDGMGVVCTVDPRYTKWRRKGPQVKYGVRCTDKYCNEYFEHAEYVPNFKCYSCRKR